MADFEYAQNKFAFWVETISSLLVIILGNLILILLFKSFILYVLLMCPLIFVMFPVYFRYPKKISQCNGRLIIQTKLKKYEISITEIRDIKKAYTRSLGSAYKIKISKIFLAFYLDSNSFENEKIEKFITILNLKL
ncbi:MAG: hypothetical protein KAX49_19685 [Halanaerobiales bacterium]|nr:hypothetical protein [Halanaerobiales bacterium]